MTHDVLVIGAGHNGLTCAAYLARAGLSVKVVERRPVIGGAAVTEEFHPGFRNSLASYTVSLLNPKITRELDLHGHGLRVVERRAQNFLPLPDGRHLLAGEGRTRAEIAKFSPRDGERYHAFAAELEGIADVLRGLVLEAPPNLTEGWSRKGLVELVRAAALGRRLSRLSMEQRRTLLDLFTKSAGEYLDGWFEAEPVKALFGFDSIVGNYTSPYTPGSAYVMLHHVFGEVNGKKGVWGHAIGGMGAISDAIAGAARAAGAEIEVHAPVREVIVEKGKAAGVVLEDGRAIRARAVAANVNPKLLYGRLVPGGALAPELAARCSWDDCRDEVADLMIDTVERYAPGFKASVIARQALTPLDLERVFGLTGGDIFHGRLSLDQLFSARPMLGHADYRGPVPGLYHCGSGAHPGGGVTGAPGHNAAQAILADLA